MRYSPQKEKTISYDIWIVGIDRIMVKPANAPLLSFSTIDNPILYRDNNK
jgi:hypothetical protein